MKHALRALPGLSLAFAAAPALAAALQVSPVTVEVPPPGATAVVNLQNAGDRPLSAQLRIFRWRQVDGRDDYEPTDAVVASPPLVDLAGAQTYTVRIVRADQTPVSEEEAYRLIVDELPQSGGQTGNVVNLALRYSIPVFFSPPEAGAPKLTWTFRKSGGQVAVTLRNDGERRVRISALRLRDRAGATASFGAGLIGYALPHSEATWLAPAARGFGGGAVRVSAQSDQGLIDAEALADH